MLNLRTMTWAALSSLVLAAPAMADKTAGQTIDDTTIQATLKTKLTEVEGAGKAFSINTDVRMGHVLMSGFVHGDKARTQAGEIAKGIKGVKQVHNFIAVTH
jgi:osmotically-inducible protein OsmY